MTISCVNSGTTGGSAIVNVIPLDAFKAAAIGLALVFVINKTFHPDSTILEFVNKETKDDLYTLKFYEQYSKECIDRTNILKNKIRCKKVYGYTIVCYGASAKGNTLLNNMRSEDISYIVDDNEMKWGLYTPGTNIPVYNPIKLKEETKLCVVMITWNFDKEIREKIEGMNVENVCYLYY